MGRKESQKNILEREVSMKDICRSEKHYFNVAYDDESPDMSDDEGDFMVQVDLGNRQEKKKSPSPVSIFSDSLVNPYSDSLVVLVLRR